MTPEERQLLTTLAERVKSTPQQQKDPEAEQLLRQLVQERPDTVYILAQTVLMQDFALRNAQARIEELQRQLSESRPQAESGSGSFLGGLFGGGRDTPRPSGSVPRVNPWESRPPETQGWQTPPRGYSQGPEGGYAPPPQGAAPQGAPVMQPSQTGGFLRNAATTAAGVAGGALLFQGINSLFSGHQGSALGGGLSGMTPRDSLSETAIVNNYGDQDKPSGGEHYDAAYSDDQGGDDGYTDADYDPGSDDDDSGGGGDWA